MEKILLKTVLLKGESGDSIANLSKVSQVGAIATYRITLTSGSTFDFEVTNGTNIDTIEKTSTSGLVDTYTITLTDGSTTTFEVTNGADGSVLNADTTLDPQSNNPIANSAVANAINAVNSDISDLQTSISNIWQTIYPVGSIYISINNANPSTFFGGTWVSWGSGRVPVGVNGLDADFNTVEKTGGEKKHILTISEIPAHSHSVRVMADDPSSSVEPFIKSAMNSQETTATTESTGGGGAHNNLQPYITCYMWKRTA